MLRGGYTRKIKVYAGKNPVRIESFVDFVVMKLTQGLLDKRKFSATDNFFIAAFG